MVRLTVLSRHVLICSCDQCHKLSNLSGFRFHAHGHRLDCSETPSIRTGSSRGSLLWSWMLPTTCGMLSFVMEQCVPDMSARILGRFSLRIVDNKANGKVSVWLGRQRKRRGPFAGPTHDSSVFDSVRLLQQLARNELDPRRWQRHRHWPPC